MFFGDSDSLFSSTTEEVESSALIFVSSVELLQAVIHTEAVMVSAIINLPGYSSYN